MLKIFFDFALDITAGIRQMGHQVGRQRTGINMNFVCFLTVR